ncbi:hypothetical protein FK268_00095 [Tsukamurella sputi]|uniref:Uncharacterized protein n=1 Tax=Tsukamurella sputi TaxID=2591848 RepID=A0A5C5RU38_9ACTN|nr:hypothetical protein [Tsukamurella sputi]TWS25721.1 hypothetical protein FK268_00095 [Tsukamurella sputi]
MSLFRSAKHALTAVAAGSAVVATTFSLSAGVVHAAGGDALVCTSEGVSVNASDRDGRNGGYPVAGHTWLSTTADASRYNAGIFTVMPKTSGTLTWQNLRSGAHGTLTSGDGWFSNIDTGSGPVRVTADTTVKWGWGYLNTAHASCTGTYNR